MIKEIQRGIKKAIAKNGITVLKSDLEEPNERPSYKIYVKPESSKMNANVRLTNYDIMVIYYARDMRDYYLDICDMKEHLTDALLTDIELENGIWLECEDISFEDYEDMLVAYTSAKIDTYIDTESDDDVMEELSLKVNNEMEIEV